MKLHSTIAAVLTAAAFLTLAIGKNEFLPAEEAFRYLAEVDGGCLKVQWNVAPGYYLYKSRLKLESGTPGITVGDARYPQGEVHHDEYFGEQEVFRDDFIVNAPLTRTNNVREMTLKLKWQGCADAGLCYAPTVWEVKVPLKEPTP